MRLIASLSTTEALDELFSHASVLQALLEFEVALAVVEARLGIIPQSAADSIAAAAASVALDPAQLARESLRAGTPGIAIAKALTEAVRTKDAVAVGFLHWGATSQDVADTAMILLLRRAQPLIEADLGRAEQALQRLAEQHQNTVMLGRTLLQPAPPITFGLKAAGWLAALRRGHARLKSAFADALLLQFGGASGTLAALGARGTEVAAALAAKLGLLCPEAPWHTQRDRLAALLADGGVLVGSLAKMARDVSLLMQSEVGEVSEAGSDGRGGSSTMPHKRNPIASSLTLAAGARMPALVASYLTAMIQEHERGTGGWQAEWPIVADAIQTLGLAAASCAEIAEGLTVDADRMRRNLAATQGTIFSEKAAMLLARKIGRDEAQKLLQTASREARDRRCELKTVLSGMAEVTRHLDPRQLNQLDVPEEYLGSAEIFRARQVKGRKD